MSQVTQRSNQIETEMLKACKPMSPERARHIVLARRARLMATTAKAWQVKTCLQCGAKVAVGTDGNIPEGGLPCGH